MHSALCQADYFVLASNSGYRLALARVRQPHRGMDSQCTRQCDPLPCHLAAMRTGNGTQDSTSCSRVRSPALTAGTANISPRALLVAELSFDSLRKGLNNVSAGKFCNSLMLVVFDLSAYLSLHHRPKDGNHQNPARVLPGAGKTGLSLPLLLSACLRHEAHGSVKSI